MAQIQAGTLSFEQLIGETKTLARNITAELLEAEVHGKSKREVQDEKMPLCPQVQAAPVARF